MVYHWFFRVWNKGGLVFKSIDEILKALQIFNKKLKSILKFKYNLRLLNKLLLIFFEVFQIVVSFLNEVLLVHNSIKFVIQWKAFIFLLMSEYMLITRVVYILYFIFLGLFGIILGFIFGLYKRNEEIYVFTLVFFLKLLYNNGFDYFLDFESLEPTKINQFSKFSLQTVKQISASSSKIMLPEFDHKSQIPWPILSDPFVSIETNFIWEQSQNYKFELFKFYGSVNSKIKS